VDASEAEEYRQANGENGVVVECDDGVQGNLPRVRNYILDKEFGNGADIVVMMDDDIDYVGFFKVDKNTNFGYVKNKITYKDFYNFIRYGSVLCQDWGYGMWGVNYCDDKMLYHHYAPFSTLKTGVGQFMVFIRNDLRFDENLPLKEDYDMSLQQLNKYRGILCLNFCFCVGDFGKLTGGTSVRRTNKREFEQWKLFRDKWGSDIVRGTSTKSGINSRTGERKDFISKYDFSHPVVKAPIDGV
jgi:hypothetical protein